MNYIIGDIGNTNIKICKINKNFKIVKTYLFDTKSKNFDKILNKNLNNIIQKDTNKNALFSSVVPNVYNKIKKILIKNKMKVFDLGPYTKNSVDYPDYAKKVARSVSTKKTNLGILVCGSGTGMAMSANKFRKIRAAVCYNSVSTRLSRTHNNANILVLGSRLTKKSEAMKLVNIFLSTKFEGGRHLRRIKKI